MEWKDFNENLAIQLEELPDPAPLTTPVQYQEAVQGLTEALQDVIRTRVPVNKPCPQSKRWWNSDLASLKKEMQKLSRKAHQCRADATHPSHTELTEMRKKYGDAILKAKHDHWADYLETATADKMWTANRYLKEPSGDSGRARIPMLRAKDKHGTEVEYNSNDEKAEILTKLFFPSRPDSSVPENFQYPKPLPYPPPHLRQSNPMSN